MQSSSSTLLQHLISAVVGKTPFKHLVAVWCPQKGRVVRLRQGKIVQNEARSVQNCLTGAEILHRENNQIRDLANRFVQFFGNSLVDTVRTFLVLAVALGDIDSCR